MATAKEIAEGFKQAAATMRREAMKAEEENARDALATTLGYFSGPFSTAAQRQMYNPRGPYSTADPHPPADPAFVNVQSGDTRDQWRVDGPRWEGDRIVTTIENPSENAARLLTGTSRMIPRPYIDAIEADIAPRIERRRQEAMDRALEKLKR